MRLPRIKTNHLVLLLLVLAGCWLYLRSRNMPMPWNVGQAGSIFQPGLQMGGGQ